MDVPELPKTRPTKIHRENSESLESNSLSESTTPPMVPSHRPIKSGTATTALPPQIPITRPKRNNIDDSSLHSSTDLPITTELTSVISSVPKTRPNTESSTSTSTPSSLSTSESKTQLPPAVPSSRPIVDQTTTEAPESDTDVPKLPLTRPRKSNLLQPPEVPSTRPRNASPQLENKVEESKEEEYELITSSEIADIEDKTEVGNLAPKKDSSLDVFEERTVTPSKESEDKVKPTFNEEISSEIPHNDNFHVGGEVNTEAPLTIRTIHASENDDVISEAPMKCAELNTNSDEVATEENNNSRLEHTNSVTNNEPEMELNVELEDQTKEETVQQSTDTLKVGAIPIGSGQRKLSNSSAQKALDDLDLLEQEIELASKEISSLLTDDSEIKKQPENDAKDLILENDIKQTVEFDIPSPSALPQIPKTRPHALKVAPKHSTTEFSENSTNIETTTPLAEASEKKAPPRVPKKSSRIAQFQEMLEQQQKADLGLLDTRKPKPKIPVKHYEVPVEGVSGGKEVEVTDGPPVQKIDRARSKFAENLNGMIGMGLPGMTFGGNPLAAIKAAKAAAEEDEDGSKEVTEESDKAKVKDVRRGRTRGPRGRKLPDSVKKAVEVNEQTLGNALTVVVEDLWSFNFNEEVLVDDKNIEDDAIELQVEEKKDEYNFQDVTSEGNEFEKSETKSEEDVINEKALKITDAVPLSLPATTDGDVMSTVEETVDKKENNENHDDDMDCEMPKTTFSLLSEEEPKVASESTSSIGSILSPLGSSASGELSPTVAESESNEGDLSEN